jgi:hypothetical protein
MNEANSSGASSRVSTAGAWTGVLVATWAALTVAWHVACLAAANVAPVLVAGYADRADEQAGPAGLPEPYARFFDLAFELARTLMPHARIADTSAALLGFALFCAGFALVRGSETGRRATRTLLAAKALHSVGSATWLVVLFVTKLDAWRDRFGAVVDEIARDAPRDVVRTSLSARATEWTNAAPVFVAGAIATSLTITAVLYWRAGRPSTRGWCAARSGLRPVDSPPAPR